ncbi:MAG TPA: hypothetical protein PKG56_00065 [Chitinophagaceae bacterium]|nr:hypothetical protein [Chitinophagaceae bacterium]HNL81760.1 hypothetical protein [Chitinophagaceae bacterium]
MPKKNYYKCKPSGSGMGKYISHQDEAERVNLSGSEIAESFANIFRNLNLLTEEKIIDFQTKFAEYLNDPTIDEGA